MSLVILGDCATNGNNTMGPEIFDDPDIIMTFSVQYHLSTTSKQAIKWFLSERKDYIKKNKITIKDLTNVALKEFYNEFKIEILKFKETYLIEWFLKKTNSTVSDFENEDHLKTVALKYLKEKDLENSWANMLECGQNKVYNYSVNGNHFGNYLIRMRKHVKNHGKPNLVLITDYSADHIFFNTKYHGKRYHALVSDSYLYMDYDDRFSYPEEVYNIRKKQYLYEKNKTQEYRDRKSRRYQRLLEKYLENENITYKYILYRQENFQFVKNKDFIDLRSIYQSWYPNKTKETYLHGENSLKKLNTQLDCAKIVQEGIKGLL